MFAFATPYRLVKLDIDIDIVKIDASYVHRLDALKRLVSYARAHVRHVVVEGVETPEHFKNALLARATHVQGRFIAEEAPLVALPAVANDLASRSANSGRSMVGEGRA